MENILKKKSSFKVKTKLRDKDERGSILSICDIPCKNVSIINCNKNTIRSNHYHKKDYHIMHVVKGEIDYFYKTIKGKKVSYLKVKKNDLILAIPSNGIHSNGFSLVRKVLKVKKIKINKNKYLKKELIKPTKIYVKEIIKLIDKNLINGCANITGGGIEDNIKRVVPNNLCANIDLDKVKTQKIFRWIQKLGVSNSEMLKTFNCGVGFCIIINKKNLNKVKLSFDKKYKPYVIGKISKNKKKVNLSGKINW